MVSQFTTRLIEKSEGSTISSFAEKLGITPAEWSRIKHGRRTPSKRIQQAALARWPELAYYLAEDAKAQHANEEGAA
jgi:transcriptional regulator with XRE-family HTH domain